MDHDTKLQMDSLQLRIDELHEATKDAQRLRDQVTAIRRALGSLGSALERLSLSNDLNFADASSIKDACRLLKRL